ncbi:peptide/nickel transport system substrate-binding protein [Spinactinospora alkalitolerans]|uniref:Peptide/nickel transport system substrate-binding protein n=1 Tax=Spinactinospora alkalitolerans TaxID=687207 RepID=A0A852TZR4_9ACTN|nr:ABC transporter substrate-binding protein [Spinactinospora alkalitolerans]NYE48552.1 peptide/nickel transport system substrate-binding protein [Spinactinospora alkalitolerans]
MSDLDSIPMKRRRFLQFLGATGAATAFSGTLSACGGPSSTGNNAAGGGSLIEAGLSYTLSTGFDPMTSTGAAPQAANLHVFEGLIDLDPVTREPYPALATSMPEQIDPTTLRLVLREGATFHDGSPVTAKDVVFSFERVLDPENASFMAQFISFLDGVSEVDEATVELRLKYPFALAAERLGVIKIVPKEIVEADRESFDAAPVGSGPFTLVSATKDDKIVFEKWDDYNGPRPAKVQDMVWRLLDDPTARVTAFQSGRVSAIEDVPYLDVDQLSEAGSVEQVQSFGLLFLMFNCAEAPFDDKRVRQALHYAIDREKLIETAFMGGAAPATGYVQETHPDYVRAATVYSHDPDKARALLDEAGVSGLEVSLVATNTGWVQDSVPLIKESWDAIGVATSLDIGESGGQYANKVESGTFRVMVAPGDPSVFGNDLDLLLRWYYDGQWPQSYYNWSETEQAATVLELLDEAAKESEPEERQRLWSQVVDLVADEAPIYPILHRKLPTAWNDEVLAGFEPIPTTGMSFLDVGRS